METGKQTSSNQNGTKTLLTALAQSPNQWVQLATVALIAISGFSNWSATWNSADRNKSEIELNRAVAAQSEARLKAELIRQVAEIHKWISDSTNEFHQGNADSAANRKTLAASQAQLLDFEARQASALENQTKILSNQGHILGEIHKIVMEFEQFKKRDQQRGAP
jgi:hypothetical protein